MQILNDSAKDVYNGEVGTVVFINTKPVNACADTTATECFSALSLSLPLLSYVLYLDHNPQGSAEALQVSFGDGRVVSYAAHEIDDHLLLAYASTVHKSQV